MIDRTIPWAKTLRTDDGVVTAVLPLTDHCLDVGAVLEAVLPVFRRALGVAAGRPLTAQDEARLVVLGALHDVGKANRGFQARIDPRVKKRVGHIGQVSALLYQSGLCRTPAALALQAILNDWGAGQHFAAAMAHHGRPLAEFAAGARSASGVWMKHTDEWVAKPDGDPTQAVVTLIDVLRARWPLAFEPGPPLPDMPALVPLFAGLVTLADWIGSDARRFPVAGPHGAARAALRAAEAGAAAEARGFSPLATPDADFRAAFDYAPNAFQRRAADIAGPVALIEAETGSGKTEAALWRWLELRRRGAVDGLYFALPRRSAAVQLQGRVEAMLRRVWGGDLEAVLAVPGYLKAGDAIGQALPGYAVRWDTDEPGSAPDSRWAAERAVNYLAARVAVGTIDQALLATLPVTHALFRAAALSRSLLVVDEVHASDAYMTALIERLLKHHAAVGGEALLLSATLGGETRARFLKTSAPSLAEAVAAPYPALSGQAVPATDGRAKTVAIETAGLMAEPAAIGDRAVAAARGGAAVLVVRNTVAGAVAVAQAVAALAPDLAFRVDGVATVHHGRFAAADRTRLDAAVETAFGKERAAGGRVLVGTQTLEQSLDIDADFLITDLSPMDVLLQRIGRLHRHRRDDRGAYGAARALVLRPAERDLSPLLGPFRPRHGLGASAHGGVYPNLVQIEATLRLLEAHPSIEIPRDNRRLIEGAVHSEALAAVAGQMGAAWSNHLAQFGSGEMGKTLSAGTVALDLSGQFTNLTFPPDSELAAVTTRLGARDLLIDLRSALASPFEGTIDRIAIPGRMAGRIGEKEQPVVEGDTRFIIGGMRFVYNAWGLARES